MRTLTDHIVSGDQAVQLQIEVTDEPGAGGANHRYEISGLNGKYNPSALRRECLADYGRQFVIFQNGPIKEAGVNGVTHEALLAIIIDRMKSFQAGPFACQDNEDALANLSLALSCLQRRTVARIKRGVEGTNAV